MFVVILIKGNYYPRDIQNFQSSPLNTIMRHFLFPQPLSPRSFLMLSTDLPTRLKGDHRPTDIHTNIMSITKGKGKVVLFVWHEGMWQNGGRSRLILHPGAVGVSGHLEASSRFTFEETAPLNRIMGGPHPGLDPLETQKTLLTLPRTKPRTVTCPARSLTTTQTTASHYLNRHTSKHDAISCNIALSASEAAGAKWKDLSECRAF